MNVASGASSVINRYRVLNFDLPFFFAVSVIEWNTAYSSAPSCVLKPPDTLVLTFNILTAASLALSKCCDNAPERKMRKIAESKQSPMSSVDAANYMKRNLEMAKHM